MLHAGVFITNLAVLLFSRRTWMLLILGPFARDDIFGRHTWNNQQIRKVREVCSVIEEKVMPILKRQTGFVDETVLVSDAEPNRILGLSFWNSKEDAERYHREQYPQIHETLKSLLETDPVIRTFEVQASTTHQITARKAA